jgi:hypothetical protein
MTSFARRTFTVASVALATACTRYQGDERHVLRLPAAETFPPVSGVLEARCGSLDCHGAPARNLRVYGVNGLRANGRHTTGNADTTEEEVDATYESVTGVEPEVLARVLAGIEQPDVWIVLSKATHREAHEGGNRLPTDGAGYRCVASWVTGEGDASACAEDVFGPEPREGETW